MQPRLDTEQPRFRASLHCLALAEVTEHCFSNTLVPLERLAPFFPITLVPFERFAHCFSNTLVPFSSGLLPEPQSL